jgi:uncharacterized protein (TIGR03790 family)
MNRLFRTEAASSRLRMLVERCLFVSEIAHTARQPDAICLTALLLLFGATSPQLVRGQTPLNERVLVVYNSSSSDSRAVARYYLAQRKIPEANTCKISANSDELIKQDDFERHVKAPIRKCLETVGRRNILYIVFSYRTPYLLTIGDRIYSLDQFVSDIWDDYSPSRPGNEAGTHGYFGEAQSQGNAYAPFVPLATYRDQPKASTIYSVWRLDAASADLAKGLVDKAIFVETHGLSGKACFDRMSGPMDVIPDYDYASGEWDIHQAAVFAKEAGFPVTEDDQKAEFGTPPAPLRCEGAVLYAGWYSLNHYNDAFSWNPGAIGIHLDSASAANPRGGTNWSANAIVKGITVTSGAVAEPYVTALPHPDQLFLYLFQGANVGDALLRSTKWLKWMIVNIGDPLYRPFPRGIAPFNLPDHRETMLVFRPQSLVGGNASEGLISLNHDAPDGGTSVSLESDHPDILTLPKTVTIAQKQHSTVFQITTRAVTAVTAVRVSMSAGESVRSNTLVLYPVDAHQ